MTNKRKQYSKQFKIDAVKRVTEQGYKVSEAARSLGIHAGILRRWKEQLTAEDGERNPKKGRRLLGQGVDVRHDFIRQHKKAYPITRLCNVMGVSRSGYYKSIRAENTKTIWPDFHLISKVKQIHKQSRRK